MIALDCGTAERANELIGVLQNEDSFGLIAVSLGYFDTLMSVSSCSTSSEISDDEQREMALSPGLLRISVGITGNLESRLQQIESAVKKVLVKNRRKPAQSMKANKVRISSDSGARDERSGRD